MSRSSSPGRGTLPTRRASTAILIMLNYTLQRRGPATA
jgi:hypothetical protein